MPGRLCDGIRPIRFLNDYGPLRQIPSGWQRSAGDDDGDDMREALPRDPGQRESIEGARHVHVGEEDRDVLGCREYGEALVAGLGCEDGKAFLLKEVSRETAQEGLVLDNENHSAV